MDEAGSNATVFLESLQDAMRQLGEVRNHDQGRGTCPDRPSLVLSGRPFRVYEKSTVREFNVSGSFRGNPAPLTCETAIDTL